MPCPLFEPRRRIQHAEESLGRFPLIYEFEGVCHAADATATPESGSQFCNLGYAKGNCLAFPPTLPVSAIRFDVSSRTAQSLTVMVVEEEDHWPRAWNKVNFVIQENRLEPEIGDVCRRAQLFHFCKSYLEKF